MSRSLLFIAVWTLILSSQSNALWAQGQATHSSDLAEQANLDEPSESSSSGFGEKDRRFAERSIAQAYLTGQWSHLLSTTRTWLARRSLDDVLQMEQFLKDTKGIPFSAMVWRSRMRLTQSGAKPPPPTVMEAFLIAKELAKSLDEEIDKLRQLDIMAEPIEDPRDSLAYRDLVWEHHVHSNEVNNLKGFALQGKEMLRHTTAARARKHDLAALDELAKYDFENYAEQLTNLKEELDERVLEVRVRRVQHAVDVLDDETSNMTERFFAAYVIGVDSESLVKAIEDGVSFERPILSDPNLVEDLNDALKRGEEAAGDLIEKSRQLFAGLHWWRRGRYGMGTEAFGLLKSKAAMSDPLLRNALIMPRVTPVPTDPKNETQYSVPNYQRRHLFIWTYEDRAFTSDTSSSQAVTSRQYTNATYSPLTNKHFDGYVNDEFW